jgi:hypothetical protein
MADASEDSTRLHRELVERHLVLAREGSHGLNNRGTTLVGLMGTTIALVGVLSARAMRPADGIGTVFTIALATILGVALALLGAGVITTLSSLRPSPDSSRELGKIATELKGDSYDEQVVLTLAWNALTHQRTANTRKTHLMKRAYWLSGGGIGAVVLATVVYGVALRV